MMKVYLCLILIMFINHQTSSMLILLFLLYFMSFFLKHDMELFISYDLTMWDTLAWSLISLSIFIFFLMKLTSQSDHFFHMNTSYNFILMSLLLILVLSFSTTNTMFFYIMFEASLIPIFTLILGWGYQPERMQAGIYMLLYTVFASLPLLLLLTLLSMHSSEFNMILFKSIFMNSKLVYMMTFFILFAFLVKLPLYMVHIWLPKAHVEAPVVGSMVLAAILLKLGGYGVIRLFKLVQNPFYMISPMFMTWAFMGGMIVSFLCLIQNDVKCLIALSSVAHMSMMIGALFTLSKWGFNGAQFIMLGHGFCSSGLFCISNMVYERYPTRSLLLLKGLKSILPTMSFWWFLLCVSNMASPPSLNLLGEINSILSLCSYSKYLMSPLVFMVFLAASYSLYLFSQTQHGNYSTMINLMDPTSVRENLILFLHWTPLNMLILSPWIFQIYI